jgi:hypothetical protein
MRVSEMYRVVEELELVRAHPRYLMVVPGRYRLHGLLRVLMLFLGLAWTATSLGIFVWRQPLYEPLYRPPTGSHTQAV